MGINELLIYIRAYLTHFGMPDERILEAIKNVDRKDFVTPDLKALAYLDQAIPIGENQTISQPSAVARMLSLLQIKENDSIMEIGTGSGWNAGLLATLAANGRVLSVEISDVLANRAIQKLRENNIKNIVIDVTDFRLVTEKFNKIMFTAGINLEQEKAIEDFAEYALKENGILICPAQSGPLMILNKKEGKITKEYTEDTYSFVPLII